MSVAMCDHLGRDADAYTGGWRARESYIVRGPDEFEEIFGLAEAGRPFELCSRTRLKRVK